MLVVSCGTAEAIRRVEIVHLGYRKVRPRSQRGRRQTARPKPNRQTRLNLTLHFNIPPLACPQRPARLAGSESARRGKGRDPVHAHGHIPTPSFLSRPAGFPCGEGLCKHRYWGPSPPPPRADQPREAGRRGGKLGHEPVVVSWPFRRLPHPGLARGARLSARVRP